MQDHDRGSYRDARRRQAKETAEALKNGKAEEMFFGASPNERKDLRKTKDKRAVDLDSLDLAPLDRGKFNAPEKVGENLRLIDMAMGNEPTPPTAPVQHPAAPKQTAQPKPTAKRKPAKKKQSLRSRASSGRRRILDSASKIPSWFKGANERDDFKPAPADSSDGVVVAKPRGRGLEIVCWLATLGLIGAGFAGAAPPFDLPREPAFPLGLQALLTSQEGLIGAGVACSWLAVNVKILRQPRGGLVTELLRCLVLAAFPAALCAGLVFGAGLTPDPGFAPPDLLPTLAPLEPHTTSLGIPLWGGVGAVVWLIALVPALVARARQPRL